MLFRSVNTTGFKRDRAVFEDLIYQNVRQSGGQTSADARAPTGMMLGTGTRVVATEKVHAQGNVITTQNALDVAISGDGFFQVLQPDGTLDLLPLMTRLWALCDAGLSADDLLGQGAALFHVNLSDGLARWATAALHAQGVSDVVLGGGCFYNRLKIGRAHV